LIVQAVREATKKDHLLLDHTLYPIIQGIKSNEQYIRLLQVFYGFMQPVYGHIEQFIDSGILPDYHLRRKPNSIQKDIRFLTQNPPSIKYCSQIPEINSVASALGALYVLEGSVMGGNIICKKIQENLGLEDENSFNFFKGYGSDNLNMWKLFLNFLDEYSMNDVEKNQLLTSASAIFLWFKNWIDNNYDGTYRYS